MIADAAGYFVPGNDKFVSLDIFSHRPHARSRLQPRSRNELAGLQFADGVANAASFHFVLPPDYTPGAAIVGSFTWHTSGHLVWRLVEGELRECVAYRLVPRGGMDATTG